jgi:hypothetical protein
VDIFGFFSWCLVVIAAVTMLWPVNTLFMALAWKVRQAGKPIVDMEPPEFWWRCAFGSLGLGVLSLIDLTLMYVLVKEAEMPAGPVALTLLLFLLAASIFYVFWMLALEDMMQGASIFLLYILLPGIPILLIGKLLHLWTRVQESAPWLWPIVKG